MKKIGLIVGSLRKESWNRKVAQVVKGMFPEGYDVDFIEIGDLPLYNEDFEAPGMEPANYAPFRKQVEASDGFIFFTRNTTARFLRRLKMPSTSPADPTAKVSGVENRQLWPAPLSEHPAEWKETWLCAKTSSSPI